MFRGNWLAILVMVFAPFLLTYFGSHFWPFGRILVPPNFLSSHLPEFFIPADNLLFCVEIDTSLSDKEFAPDIRIVIIVSEKDIVIPLFFLFQKGHLFFIEAKMENGALKKNICVVLHIIP